MTGAQFFEHELKSRWTPVITDRKRAVPLPLIHIEGEDEDKRRSFDLDEQDRVAVTPGSVSTEPQSVHWTEEKEVERVTIDCLTSDSRSRLVGRRDPVTNEPPELGGLKGEVKRILNEIRRGYKEYSIINGFEWQDLSGNMPYGRWRGAWEVRLEQRGKNIPNP